MSLHCENKKINRPVMARDFHLWYKRIAMGGLIVFSSDKGGGKKGVTLEGLLLFSAVYIQSGSLI